MVYQDPQINTTTGHYPINMGTLMPSVTSVTTSQTNLGTKKTQMIERYFLRRGIYHRWEVYSPADNPNYQPEKIIGQSFFKILALRRASQYLATDNAWYFDGDKLKQYT